MRCVSYQGKVGGYFFPELTYYLDICFGGSEENQENLNQDSRTGPGA
jgi:hypothetical protein